MRFTRAAREKRDRRIVSLYEDGLSSGEIAGKLDFGLSADGVLKVLQRNGVARRGPGPQPGGGASDATPADDEATRLIECPRCRRQHPARRDQPNCDCGWQFIVVRGSSRPRMSTTTKFFELDAFGRAVQTSGPVDDDD